MIITIMNKLNGNHTEFSCLVLAIWQHAPMPQTAAAVSIFVYISFRFSIQAVHVVNPKLRV